MKTKIALLFLSIALSAGAQTNFIITNMVPSSDTNWLLPSGHSVTDKINANYGNLVGWLNAHNATNSAEDFAISNLTVQIGTNIAYLLTLATNATYANGRNYTNLWGTNITAGTLNSNSFDAATMAWLNSLQTTRYISTNLTLATSATILFTPPFKDTNYGAFQDLSAGLPTSLIITGKTTNSISTTMGLFTGTEAFGLIHN